MRGAEVVPVGVNGCERFRGRPRRGRRAKCAAAKTPAEARRRFRPAFRSSLLEQIKIAAHKARRALSVAHEDVACGEGGVGRRSSDRGFLGTNRCLSVRVRKLDDEVFPVLQSGHIAGDFHQAVLVTVCDVRSQPPARQNLRCIGLQLRLSWIDLGTDLRDMVSRTSGRPASQNDLKSRCRARPAFAGRKSALIWHLAHCICDRRVERKLSGNSAISSFWCVLDPPQLKWGFGMRAIERSWRSMLIGTPQFVHRLV